MAVPTRSQNSSWHSLWDPRGTQAPQLRQSNNTLGGVPEARVYANLEVIAPTHIQMLARLPHPHTKKLDFSSTPYPLTIL